MAVADPAHLPVDVFVYRNLHKKGPNGEPVFSVRDTATGRVVAHTSHIALAAVTFPVSHAGRDRVRREGRKNVHAGVRGRPATSSIADGTEMRRAYYNPYRVDTFIDAESETPLLRAAVAVVGAGGVLYQA